MKKFIFLLVTALVLGATIPTLANAATAWKAVTPEGYTPINWVKERGINSFMKVPTGNGYIDYLTVIYLPYNQINFFNSTTPPISWGPARAPFDVVASEASSTVQDWAVPRMVAEQVKADNSSMRFFWNVPFFNITVNTTNLSLSLKSTNATTTYISTGSRPENDIAQKRRMLIVNNEKSFGQITDFDERLFVSTSTGDQAVEGFAPFILKTDGNGAATGRLFLGMKPGGKELVVYCSQSATPLEASNALSDAGVPSENQLQADGGASAACGYNLPGQYFVAPGRTLPHLMGATPVLYRATVTTEGLNVRSGAGPKFTSVRKLKKSLAVTVYEEKSGWARISNKQEWVSVKLLKKI